MKLSKMFLLILIAAWLPGCIQEQTITQAEFDVIMRETEDICVELIEILDKSCEAQLDLQDAICACEEESQDCI